MFLSCARVLSESLYSFDPLKSKLWFDLRVQEAFGRKKKENLSEERSGRKKENLRRRRRKKILDGKADMATLKIVNVFGSSESSLHLQGSLTNPSSSNIFSTNHHVSNQFSDRRLRVIADTTIAHRFYHPSSDRRTR